MKTYQSIFEITNNFPPQRCGRLGSAPGPVRTLLSPGRAWSASALVATALFTLSGQPAQALEAPAQALEAPALASSGLVSSNTVGAPPASELRQLGESIARGESPVLSQQAQSVGRSATFPNTPWGVYYVHFKDLALSGGGPNGPDTNQWTYTLALRSNGTAELYGEEDQSKYPGFGTNNCVSRAITDIGPNLTATATWGADGSTLRIGGPGYGWDDDSCEPGWHIYNPFSNEGESFTYQFAAGFTAVQLTYIGQGNFFPPSEGKTFIFQKISSYSPEVSQPAVSTYGADGIIAFVTGADGHLGVNYWDGSAWHLADQGAPPATTASGSPGVSTDGADRIYAFVTGANGHLFLNWWNGSAWQWEDQGLPPGTSTASAPGVSTYGADGIIAFVTGADGQLGVNYWDGSAWHWAEQGAEP